MPTELPAFRRRYLRFADLQEHLKGLALRHPDLVRVERIGSSSEGRPLYVVVVGTDPERERPALWIDANMHANELIGTNVGLAFVDDLLALHAGENRHGLSAAVMEKAKDALVYVMPTMSPDGAEAIFEDGRFVRSSPLDDKPSKRARWRQVDVDGDGKVQRMRKLDPCGSFVESKSVAGLMLPRDVDDDGPFFSLYPEGVIEDFDGETIPPWMFFDDNPLDLNRNFSSGWKPEPQQEGAGNFAGSSPEARAVMAFASSKPNIFFWLNLHTYGGCWIRPLGDAPDCKLAGDDRAIFRLVEEWTSAHVGVPTVSSFEEFCYQPEKPLAGDLCDYAFLQRGAFAWSVELWDLYARAGLPRTRPFVDVYGHQSRAQMEVLARYLIAAGASPLSEWKKTAHPQLGDVEVGGLDPRFSIWNPPEGPLVDEVSRQHAAVFFRMLALLPRLHVEARRTSLGACTLVEVTVENRGGLATSGPAVAKELPHNEPLRAVVVDGARVRDGAVRLIGHLGGTHAGRFGGVTTWPYQTTGDAPRKTVRFVVDGDAPITIRVGSVRTGFVDVVA
ncbi:MAG: M14 family metallopeptidase [Deltaproteobacteria bacterium]|nr:M14 family metallopeptidase [Deltaproteobacteria bacterium]